MKTPSHWIVSLLAAAACFTGIGCEKHDPAVTVKGYAEKEEKKQAVEKQKSLLPESASSDAPAYFPEKKTP